MKSIERLGAMVESQLQSMNWNREPKQLYLPLDYFLQLGGKRMRPVLTLMAGEMFGVPAEGTLPAALSVELFHNFSLIHDDIMDDAPLRRKQVTVHEKWNLNTAILSGDVLLIKAYQEIAKQAPEHLPALIHLFNQTSVEVCEGQQYDMDFETRSDVSIDEYIEMIRLKTSVLLGCALEMGAIIAGADLKNRENCYAFGEQLGIAFQIKDDLLDLYGDPEKFGKQIGGDVLANKKTLLYLLAKKEADSEQRARMISWEKEENKLKKVMLFRALFDQLKVPALAKEYMDKHTNVAFAALGKVDAAVENKKDLLDLAHYLINRDH